MNFSKIKEILDWFSSTCNLSVVVIDYFHPPLATHINVVPTLLIVSYIADYISKCLSAYDNTYHPKIRYWKWKSYYYYQRYRKKARCPDKRLNNEQDRFFRRVLAVLLKKIIGKKWTNHPLHDHTLVWFLCAITYLKNKHWYCPLFSVKTWFIPTFFLRFLLLKYLGTILITIVYLTR